MQTSSVERRAIDIARSVEGLEEMCMAFDDLLRRIVPYQVAAWSTHDPATGLFTSCVMCGVPKDHTREADLFRHEFSDDEPATFRSLIASGETATILSHATDGDLRRAGRYRDLLEGYGVSDELRVVLWNSGTAWGSAALYRLDGTFERRDAQRVADLAPHFAEGLRLGILRGAAHRPSAVDEPPGILEVALDGTVAPLTEPARSWLAVGGAQLATAATATATALRAGPDWQGASARVPLQDGRMLSLHAAATVGGDGTVAVIVDRARPAEVSDLLVEAYGLTARQREVLGLLLLGRSLIEIAHTLDISEHTANDHRKAIYRRVGVNSRSELAGLLQVEQYSPRVAQGVPPAPYGGFLEEPSPAP